MNEINPKREDSLTKGYLVWSRRPRRLLIKGMAGLAATLVSSSLSAAIAAQTQTHQPGLLAIRYLQTRLGGDLLLPRAVKVDISKLFTRRPQPKGSCRLVSYTPSGFRAIPRP